MTKKIYRQPEIQVAHLDNLYLMQAASPGDSGTTYYPFTHSTNDQW